MGVARLFPTPATLLAADPADLPLPGARRLALIALAAALAGGALILDPAANPDRLERQLVALPGIGPWTAGYIRMRALGDADAFLPSDLGVRRSVAALGGPDRRAEIAALAESWRPWRAYALMHLWAAGWDRGAKPTRSPGTAPAGGASGRHKASPRPR